MGTRTDRNPGISARMGDLLQLNSGRIILAAVVVTPLLVISLMAMSPTRTPDRTLQAMCLTYRMN